jgi:Flp pilus assembly protein TadG
MSSRLISAGTRQAGGPASLALMRALWCRLTGPLRGSGSLRHEDGQGVVEFALVLPLLAVLAVTLFAFGKAVFFWNNVTQVANEGARLAAVDAGAKDGSFNFDSQLRSNLVTGSSTKIYVSAPNPTAGNQVTVYVCRTYSVPFYGNIQIVGKATMRLEQNLTSPTILAESTSCP